MDRCMTLALGRLDYLRAWELQRSLHRRVADGQLPNILLLMEHPHVYTVGRRGKESDVLASPQQLDQLGAEVQFVDRGGEVTYHGPGQLVGYPIVNLRARRGGPLQYVRSLEEGLIDTLSEFDIDAHSEGQPTGVWVNDAKIASIGVKISRGVTMHGFGLNVTPDLSYFDHIVACGAPGGRMTSMSSETSGDMQVEDVVPVVARQLGHAFEWEMQQITLGELGEVPALA